MKVNEFLRVFNKPHFVWPRRAGKTTEAVKFCFEHWCNYVWYNRNTVNQALIAAHKHIDDIGYEAVINKKENAVYSKAMRREDMKLLFRFMTLSEITNWALVWCDNKDVFIDEMWVMDMYNIIDVLTHNNLKWYSGTMPVVKMNKMESFYEYNEDEHERYKAAMWEKFYKEEILCDFD